MSTGMDKSDIEQLRQFIREGHHALAQLQNDTAVIAEHIAVLNEIVDLRTKRGTEIHKQLVQCAQLADRIAANERARQTEERDEQEWWQRGEDSPI